MESETVFVPKKCYTDALKVALELALELRARCDDAIHREQVESIDAALLEAGEGRPPIQAVADRVPLKEIKSGGCYWRPFESPPRQWERQIAAVTQREFEAIDVGDRALTRGVFAQVTMKTHQYAGRYFLRFDFAE